MTATVRVAGADEGGDVGAIAVPVARDDEGLLVPQGLPDAYAGVTLPRVLDATWGASQGFDAKAGQSLAVRAIGLPCLSLVGIGDAAKADAEVWRRFGAAAVRAAGRAPRVTVLLPLPSTISTGAAARAVVEGALLAADHAGAEKTSKEPTKPTEVVIVPVGKDGVSDEDRSAVERGATDAAIVAGSVCWARDLINRPAAQLTPRALRPRGAAAPRGRPARDRGRSGGRPSSSAERLRRAARRLEGLLRAAATRAGDL